MPSLGREMLPIQRVPKVWCLNIFMLSGCRRNCFHAGTSHITAHRRPFISGSSPTVFRRQLQFVADLCGIEASRFFGIKTEHPEITITRSSPQTNFEGELMENGAFYINTVKNVLQSGNRLSGKIGIYEMPEYTAIEIDEPDDPGRCSKTWCVNMAFENSTGNKDQIVSDRCGRCTYRQLTCIIWNGWWTKKIQYPRWHGISFLARSRNKNQESSQPRTHR